MIHDDSKYMKSYAEKLNKKEGHAKAKTIALEKKKGGHKQGEREAQAKKQGWYPAGHKNYGDVYEK